MTIIHNIADANTANLLYIKLKAPTTGGGMDGMLSVVSYGIGTILGFLLIGGLIILVLHDVTQKKHTVLRNYPVIGRLRFFFEDLGEYFRQYFFAGDRDEMPFNSATRGWIYKEAKNEGGIIGFGSTNERRFSAGFLSSKSPSPAQSARYRQALPSKR